MNDRQENKLSMYLAVKNVLDSNQKLWNSVPALVRAIQKLNDKLLTINILRAEQEASLKGVAMNKQDRKAVLIQSAIKVISKARAYAMDKNNQELAEAVKYPKTSLEQTRDTTLYHICQMIYDKSMPFINEMNEYGLTTTELNDLKSKTDAYGEIVQKPREVISKRKTTGETLNSVMSDIDKLFKDQIDNLVKTYEETNKDVVHTYKNARLIVDSGKRKAETEAPVQEQ